MQMKKVLLVTLMMTALLLSAFGAGQQDSSSESAVKAGEDVVKYGFYGPLTGPNSYLGSQSRNGTALAIKQINERGGLLGKEVVLIAYDDNSSPEKAVKAVTRLIEDDHVHVIIGSLHSGNILASAPVVEKAKIPEMGTGTSPVWLQKGYQYLFRPFANNTWCNKTVVNYIVDVFGYKTIATIEGSDAYAKDGAANVREVAEARGMTVVAAESYQQNDMDFTGQITKILKADPDALFLYGITTEQGPLVKQLRQFGWKGLIFSAEGFGTPEFREVAGDAATDSVFSAIYVIPDVPEEAATKEQKAFLDAYIEEYGTMPISENAYRCYDGVNLLALAIETAGTLDGEAIKDALHQTHGYVGLAGEFDFRGKNGEGRESWGIYTIQDGKIYDLDIWMKEHPDWTNSFKK